MHMTGSQSRDRQGPSIKCSNKRFNDPETNGVSVVGMTG